MRGKCRTPCMCQHHLSGGGGGLFLLQRQNAPVNPKNVAAKGNGTAGHHNHILAIALQCRDILGDTRQPAGIDGVMIIINQNRRADLDDNGSGRADGRCSRV